ncbi:MAG: zf-HC2 domain-containing protein [Pseudohongiellaceae bacterium]
MTTNTETQCYFVQLQIDSFLDGELATAQQEVFMGHVSSCAACAKELQFARNLHDAVMDLPMMDCSDAALRPIQQIATQLPHQQSATPSSLSSVWGDLRDWFQSIPMGVRIGAPAFALVLALVLPTSGLVGSGAGAPAQQVAAENSPQDYSPEDIQQALQDLNLAIDYLNDVSQRTEVMIGERFVMAPLQESLNASFDRSRTNRRNEGGRVIQSDPI